MSTKFHGMCDTKRWWSICTRIILCGVDIVWLKKKPAVNSWHLTPILYVHVYTSGIWGSIYLVELLRVSCKVKYAYSVIQNNYNPVCVRVCAHVCQQNARHKHFTTNIQVGISLNTKSHNKSPNVTIVTIKTHLSRRNLTAFTGLGNSRTATWSFLRSSQMTTRIEYSTIMNGLWLVNG